VRSPGSCNAKDLRRSKPMDTQFLILALFVAIFLLILSIRQWTGRRRLGRAYKSQRCRCALCGKISWVCDLDFVPHVITHDHLFEKGSGYQGHYRCPFCGGTPLMLLSAEEERIMAERKRRRWRRWLRLRALVQRIRKLSF